MAEQQPQRPPQQPPNAQEQSKAIADSNAEAEKRQIDETVPGGRYLINGVMCNSEGEPIKDADKEAKKDGE